MSINIRYFASLKEQVGRSKDELQFDTALTVHDVWQRLNPELAMPESVLASINMEYVQLDTLVQDGDELAFFPPVTGG